jgi:hypothetical protein
LRFRQELTRTVYGFVPGFADLLISSQQARTAAVDHHTLPGGRLSACRKMRATTIQID